MGRTEAAPGLVQDFVGVLSPRNEFEGRDGLSLCWALWFQAEIFSPAEIPTGFGVIFCASLFIYKGGAKIAQVWTKLLKNGIFSRLLFQPFNVKFSFQVFPLLCKCHILRALLGPLTSAALTFSAPFYQGTACCVPPASIPDFPSSFLPEKWKTKSRGDRDCALGLCTRDLGGTVVVSWHFSGICFIGILLPLGFSAQESSRDEFSPRREL